MSIGDSITFIGCMAGLMLASPALFIFLSMIFWRSTERATTRLTRGAILPFFMGLVPLVIVGALGSLLLSLGSVFQLMGSIIWLFLLVWGFTGLAVVARLMGVRLTDMAGQSQNALLELVVGSLVLTFAIAFPLIGWFMVFPFAAAIGTGAWNMALVGRLFGWFSPAEPS